MNTRVYVGTYRKYNNGSLAGGWIDLADCEDYKQFLAKCKALHKNEHDPEFMIQDFEGFPDGLNCMEWLSEQDFNDVKLAMKEEEQEAEGKPSINIIDYSDKAFAVVGDTKAVKDELKKLGGRFNGKLSCGAGWIFANKMRQEVERFISSDEVAEAVRQDRNTPSDGNMFVEALKDFQSTANDDYYVKGSVGAIHFHGGFILIPKPSIDNQFCFHDEGPNYEFYKNLMADKETRLSAYFKSENLGYFDNKIDHITNGDRYNGDKRVWWKKTTYDNRIVLRFYDGNDNEYTLCSTDETQMILKGLQFGRDKFEQRLDKYLKRYGTSKIHTWTYWADA